MIVSDASKLAERKQRAIGRLIVGFDGLEPSAEMLEVLSGYTPAGVILFARNIESREQTLACNRQLSNLWSEGETPWISLDQEGGRVRRIKELRLPTMRTLGELHDLSTTKRVDSCIEHRSPSLGVYRELGSMCRCRFKSRQSSYRRPFFLQRSRGMC